MLSSIYSERCEREVMSSELFLAIGKLCSLFSLSARIFLGPDINFFFIILILTDTFLHNWVSIPGC